MNIKDMLVVVSLALITTWAIDYLILRRYRVDVTNEVQSGQSFSAPEQEELIRPLNVAVEIGDKKKVSQVTLTQVHTDWAELTFSSEGACLERAQYRLVGDAKEPVTTIYPGLTPQEKAFFVAFEQYTPYHYKLIETKDNEADFTIRYEAAVAQGIFSKKFVVDKKSCKIDMTCTMQGSEQATQLRFFYPSPVMPDLKCDLVSGIVSNVQGAVEKTPISKIQLQSGWWSPSLFGSENKYFVHALVAATAHSIERAYYLVTSAGNLVSVLESYPIQNESWTLSFYMGPKEGAKLKKVDLRLEETLDYSGILAPLSKFLLAILVFLHSYVHNYGIAILLLTLLIKLILLPFAVKGEKSVKKSKDMQRKMQYLQQKYKNDTERFRIEQAELIRKEGVPQLAGCLPMLAQFPIFIALNRVLSNSIELYKAPFFGWITDLSAPDPYYFFPICFFLAMMMQALYSDPNQRMGLMGAAIIFGVMSLQFATGLVLYICASACLGILQNWFQKKYKVL